MLLQHNIPVYEKLEDTMRKNNKALIVTATGMGKSYLGLEYIEKHNLHALVVVPKIVIGNAWEKLSHNIQSITYHSFIKMKDLRGFDLVIFDEAHHCGASTWEPVIKDFMNTSNIPVIGLTADPRRWSDGARNMGDVLFEDSVVNGYSLKDAIQTGLLPHLKYITAFYDLGSFKEKYKSKNLTAPLLSKFNYAIENCAKIENVLLENMPKTGRKGVVFVDSISQIKKAYNLFADIFPDKPLWKVHSKQSQKKNDANIKEYNEADEGFIISVDMFNEGLHLSGVNTIIMMRRTVSPNIFFQQIGRAMSAGKSKDIIIFDFVGNSVQLKTTSAITRRKSVIVESLEEICSDQLYLGDYTKDILDVIKEIEDYLSNHWTEEEDEILRKYYPLEGKKVVRRIDNHTEFACQKRACYLGITYSKFNSWTKEEEDIIRQYYPLEGKRVADRLTRHSERACRSKAVELGVKYIRKLEWTKEEDEILRKYYPTEGQKVAKRFSDGRSERDCRSRATHLKVYSLKNNYWTEEEVNIIKQYYPIEGLANIAKRLPNRSESSIQSKARKLGISSGITKKEWTQEEIEKVLKLRKQGLKLKEIAEHFEGVGSHSIGYLLRKIKKGE